MGDVCLLAANLLASSLANRSTSDAVQSTQSNTATLTAENEDAASSETQCQRETQAKLSLKPESMPPESSSEPTSAVPSTVPVIGQAITAQPASLQATSAQSSSPSTSEPSTSEPSTQPIYRTTTAIALPSITPPETLAPEISPPEQIQLELSQPKNVQSETVQPSVSNQAVSNQASQRAWPALLHQQQASNQASNSVRPNPRVVTQTVARSEQTPENWPSLLHQRQQSEPTRRTVQASAPTPNSPQTASLTQPTSTSTQPMSTQSAEFQAAVDQTLLSPEVRTQITGESIPRNQIARGAIAPPTLPLPSITPSPSTLRPRSGSQMYAQRWAALHAGKLYTRIPTDQFAVQWRGATRQPTYEDWKALLAQEAQVMAGSQGSNRLTVMLGDSLLMWYPTEQLPRDRFVLNQGISGDTTQGVLQRLSYLDRTSPTDIHVMAGINDLKNGAADQEVLTRLQQIMQQLRQHHPQAQIYVHSLLPTRLANLPATRIQHFNQRLSFISQQQNVRYLDLAPYFADTDGNLQQSLTTDGLHLNAQGYANWQRAIQNAQQTAQYAQQ